MRKKDKKAVLNTIAAVLKEIPLIKSVDVEKFVVSDRVVAYIESEKGKTFKISILVFAWDSFNQINIRMYINESDEPVAPEFRILASFVFSNMNVDYSPLSGYAGICDTIDFEGTEFNEKILIAKIMMLLDKSEYISGVIEKFADELEKYGYKKDIKQLVSHAEETLRMSSSKYKVELKNKYLN